MSTGIVLRKTSLTDYPGRVSSVIFIPGCNLRCPWCHNRELVLGTAQLNKELISLDEGLAHIRKRQSVLGGVVLSGGEPCLYPELDGLIAEIKKLPLPVKLDTNGMCPDVLEKLFRCPETCPDYIALDLKTSPDRYAELLPEGSRLPAALLLKKSAALVRESGIAYEFRSLDLPRLPGQEGFFTERDIEALAPLTGIAAGSDGNVRPDGVIWHLRPFRGGNCLNKEWDKVKW